MPVSPLSPIACAALFVLCSAGAGAFPAGLSCSRRPPGPAELAWLDRLESVARAHAAVGGFGPGRFGEVWFAAAFGGPQG